ncbi:MAG: hypothetical protein JXA37_13715 [Chloroflexia bacterium]|nr:hypothetical protein [Chloroflexia bacterium]
MAAAWPCAKWEGHDLRRLLAFMGEQEGDVWVTPLTRREAEMACLAAQGLTHQEIAQALCVTKAYVKRTLSNQAVYSKVAATFDLNGTRVNQTVLAYLLRPYLDWVARGRPSLS